MLNSALVCVGAVLIGIRLFPSMASFNNKREVRPPFRLTIFSTPVWFLGGNISQLHSIYVSHRANGVILIRIHVNT